MPVHRMHAMLACLHQDRQRRRPQVWPADPFSGRKRRGKSEEVEKRERERVESEKKEEEMLFTCSPDDVWTLFLFVPTTLLPRESKNDAD